MYHVRKRAPKKTKSGWMDIENKNGTPEKTVRKGLGSMGQRPGETSVKRRDNHVTLGGKDLQAERGVGRGLQSLLNWCMWSRSKETSITGERQYDINTI